MSRLRTILLSAVLAALSCAAYGADTAISLLPADSATVFKLSANAGEYAKMSTAAVTGQPFSKALRIEVTKKPQRSGDVMISAPVDVALAGGDVLLVSFWMRSGVAGEATLYAGFRAAPGAAAAGGAAGRGRGGFRGFPALNAPALAGTAWKKVQFPFALSRAYDKGEAEVTFTVGLH